MPAMPDLTEDFLMRLRPTPDRPLQGQTVLVVEDSRFASEALRLLCLRSGARVRRADSLASAARHLASYRPGIALVDPGLPDGCGLSLISELKHADPPVPVVLAISGDAAHEGPAAAAGADGFLAKPLSSLAAFHAAILAHLPDAQRPAGPRSVAEEGIRPDPLALQDDLTHLADDLRAPGAPARLPYFAQFLAALARASGDPDLDAASQSLARLDGTEGDLGARLRRVAERLEGMLGNRAVV